MSVSIVRPCESHYVTEGMPAREVVELHSVSPHSSLFLGHGLSVSFDINLPIIGICFSQQRSEGMKVFSDLAETLSKRQSNQP